MFAFHGFSIKFQFGGSIDVVPLAVKATKPSGGQFTFIKVGDSVTGTFSGVSPVVPSENVTTRTVLITVNGVELGNFDLLATGSVDFPCNEGELCRAVVTDTNAAGPISGDPVEATATVGGGGGVPTKPTGGSFSFRA